MGTITLKGTCGACCRLMALGSDGRVKRHGWREAGGTRAVGRYGNVVHSGACFGVGWLPYEVSPDCTKAFVERVLFPMGVSIQEHLTRLGTHPPLIMSGSSYMRNEFRGAAPDLARNAWDGYSRWEVRLVDEDPESHNQGFYLGSNGSTFYKDEMSRIPSYETHQIREVELATSRWNAVSRDGLYCCQMISDWKPQEAKTIAKKVALVHTPSLRQSWSPACLLTFRRGSSNGSEFKLTQSADEVTCSRCLRILEECQVANVHQGIAQ